MEIYNSKACLVEEHSDQLLVGICTDKDCICQSRSFCSQCLQESNHNHQQCGFIFGLKNFQEPELIIKKGSNFQSMLIKQLEVMESQKYQILDEIDKKQEFFIDRIMEKLQQIVKETKIKVQNHYKGIEKEIKIQIRNLNQTTNLEYLGQKIKEFNSGGIKIDEINEIFKDIQSKSTSKGEELDLKKKIQKLPVFQFNKTQFLQMQHNILSQLDSLQLIQQETKTVGKLGELTQEFGKFIKINQSYKLSPEDLLGVLVSKNTFKIQEAINFQFKLKFQKKSQFSIGICSQNVKTQFLSHNNSPDERIMKFYYDNNNSGNVNKGDFANKGQKSIQEVFKSGGTFRMVSVQTIQGTYLRIQDQWGQFMVETRQPLPGYVQNWKIVIQVSGDQEIEIL